MSSLTYDALAILRPAVHCKYSLDWIESTLRNCPLLDGGVIERVTMDGQDKVTVRGSGGYLSVSYVSGEAATRDASSLSAVFGAACEGATQLFSIGGVDPLCALEAVFVFLCRQLIRTDHFVLISGVLGPITDEMLGISDE